MKMYLYLQVDNGVVTGTLRSSHPKPPDGGKRGLPVGRSFVIVGDEDDLAYDLPDTHWHGGTVPNGQEPRVFTFTPAVTFVTPKAAARAPGIRRRSSPKRSVKRGAH